MAITDLNANLYKISLRRTSKRRLRQTLNFYAFISPWLLGFIALTVIPLIGGVIISFTNYDGFNFANLKFIGLRNFERFLGDQMAHDALRKVFVWTALNTPLWLVCSFFLAYLLNQISRVRGLFRTLIYITSIIPIVVAARTWTSLLHANYGLANKLQGLVIPGTQINWLVDYGLLAVTAVLVWTGLTRPSGFWNRWLTQEMQPFWEN